MDGILTRSKKKPVRKGQRFAAIERTGKAVRRRGRKTASKYNKRVKLPLGGTYGDIPIIHIKLMEIKPSTC